MFKEAKYTLSNIHAANSEVLLPYPIICPKSGTTFQLHASCHPLGITQASRALIHREKYCIQVDALHPLFWKTTCFEVLKALPCHLTRLELSSTFHVMDGFQKRMLRWEKCLS